MEGLTREEKRKTLDSFVNEDDSGLESVHRSELEAWSVCPFQAKAREDGRCKIVGLAAEAGEAIHHALSLVTREYVENGPVLAADAPWMVRDELRTLLEHHLRMSRPDLQPEALAGMMPSSWAWARFLASVNPGNILAFDGGDDCGRSSQFAYDFPDLGTRVTSELDLLVANPQTVELIDETDYKTGHKRHTEGELADSFQFQTHAVLVLTRFPDVKAMRLRVWDTRSNHVTYSVTFPRSRLDDYTFRVREAVRLRREYKDAEQPPCWPVKEKCEICDAAALCPVGSAQYPISEEPEAVLRDLIAVEARADALRQRLAAHVNKTKTDVQCGHVRFGKYQKPYNPQLGLYDLTPKKKGKANGDSDSN